MKDISNSTLALLVVMAIMVSVFGTLLSITKLDQVGITGFASTSTSASGRANITIPSSAYINLTDSVVDLGTVDTGAWNTSDEKADWFVVRNDGNVNVSIEIWDTTQDDTWRGNDFEGSGPFESQSDGADCLTPTPSTCFKIKCYNSSSANATVVGCNNTYYTVPTSTAGDRRFILKLFPSPNFINDTAWFGVNMTVPSLEPSGTRLTTSITFQAAEST